MSDRYYTGTSKSRSFDTTPIGVSDPVKVLESTIKKLANILNAFNDTNRSPEAAFKASGMRNQNIFNNQGRTDYSRLKRIYLSTRKALDTLQIPDNLSYTQRTILARLFPELEIMIGQSKEKLKGRFLPVYTVDKTQLNELIECYFPKKITVEENKKITAPYCHGRIHCIKYLNTFCRGLSPEEENSNICISLLLALDSDSSDKTPLEVLEEYLNIESLTEHTKSALKKAITLYKSLEIGDQELVIEEFMFGHLG